MHPKESKGTAHHASEDEAAALAGAKRKGTPLRVPALFLEEPSQRNAKVASQHGG